MKDKPLWLGSFNWQGQTITEYTHARNEHVAYCNICERIAQKAETSFRRVYNYFFGKKGLRYTLKSIVKEEHNATTWNARQDQQLTTRSSRENMEGAKRQEKVISSQGT